MRKWSLESFSIIEASFHVVGLPAPAKGEVLLRDGPGPVSQAADLRLGEITPFLLEALDVAEPNDIVHFPTVDDRAARLRADFPLLGFLRPEPIPAGKGLPAAEDLVVIDKELPAFCGKVSHQRTFCPPGPPGRTRPRRPARPH